MNILVVCTGNTCRSPMTEALLRAKLDALAVDARVHSAGTLPWIGAASNGARAAMREYGLDLDAHRSRALSAELLDDADLVLGMTRQHVWSVASYAPAAVERAFLVGEVIRLGTTAGPRAVDEPLRAWATRVATLRADPRVPGQPQDEVADPAGESLEVYRATAARLDAELDRLVSLLAGTT
jgi:low molecular weight protein-tyrosine phosphatase